VLYKLSEALERKPESRIEAERDRGEAELLLREGQKRLMIGEGSKKHQKSEGDGNEKLYDELIYVLWR
jgi:hypothetical protein